MSLKWSRIPVSLALLAALFGWRMLGAEDAPQAPSGDATVPPPAVADSADISRVPLDVAKDRAALMHNVYLVTMDVMHERYFHGDRAMVPARAMEDVFEELERTTHSQARWISVNLKAMSIDHDPATAFEKRAAKELADGRSHIEEVEGGYYRRAGSVPLTGGCLSCHSGFFNKPSSSPKFAGLVISIPITPSTESAADRPAAP